MHDRMLMTLVGSGESADVYRLPGGRVLKLFHPGVEPGVMTREHDGASQAHAQGLRVGRPIDWRTIDGRRGIVFEELAGKPLIAGQGLRRIWRARSALRLLAECHANIHRCSGGDLAHAQHDILYVRIRDADVSEDLRQAALTRLAELPPGDRLCHGDFHPGNAIRTPDGVAAVDWSNGCSGDPAADVARTDLLLRYGGYGPMLRKFPPLRYFRNKAADLYLRTYLQRSGMDADRIAAWFLPVAISCLVSGSMIEREPLIEAIRLR